MSKMSMEYTATAKSKNARIKSIQEPNQTGVTTTNMAI